ncbi:MAG: STAS domain-containing protein [Leptospiraceae bacterium]|nr:STAS domain-containing protein [Leptospiraceae bacterium]
MEISVKKNENQILFELEGSLDIYTSLDLKSSLEENVKENNPDVVIDLDKLTYIDSSGIGILIKALNYIQGLNGKLCVANLKPAIEKVFKVSGLTSYFEILSTDEFKSRYTF